MLGMVSSDSPSKLKWKGALVGDSSVDAREVNYNTRLWSKYYFKPEAPSSIALRKALEDWVK